MIPKYFEELEFPEYEGRIDYDIEPPEEEKDEVIKHLSQNYQKDQLVEFFNRLELIIKELRISNFDERLLISLYTPWIRQFPEDIIIWVQVGIHPNLIYPSKDLMTNKYLIDASLMTSNKTSWIDRIRKHYSDAADITKFRLNKNEKSPFYEKHVNSRDFRQLHQQTIYKAAIDHDFRQNFINKIEKNK